MAKKDEKLMTIKTETIELDGEKLPLYKIMIKNPNKDWDEYYKTIGWYNQLQQFPYETYSAVNASILRTLNCLAQLGYKLVY